MTLAELVTKLNIGFDAVTEIAAVLVGTGAVSPAHDDTTATSVRKKCLALNREIRARTTHDGQATHLASPVSGGGVQVGRFEQFFLNAIEAKKTTAPDQARFAWSQLESVGQGAVVDGKTLRTAAENIDYLTGLADSFAREGLPLYRKLGVV